MLYNPFAKPHTPEEWVLSSVCWTLVGLTAWIALTWPFIQTPLPYEYKKYEPTLLFACFIIPYVTVLVNATPPSFAFESSILFVKMSVIMWTITLVSVLIGWLLVALFILALSGPSTSWN